MSYKLHNFVALDPKDPTQGFAHVGAADAEVWDEFASDSARLAATAAAIAADIESGVPAPPAYEDEDDPENAEAEEGRLLTRRHRQRERNPTLAKKKKAQARKQQGGKLACEACGFDLADRFGGARRGIYRVSPHCLRQEPQTRVTNQAGRPCAPLLELPSHGAQAIAVADDEPATRPGGLGGLS